MSYHEVIEYVSRECELFRREKEIPGVALGLIHNGELIYSEGFGEKVVGGNSTPTAETVFRIASMTKSFTATAILRLRDAGLVHLDEPLVAYLPWSATIGLPKESSPITIRDLLTMGAGLPTDDPWGDRQENLPIAEFDAMVGAGLTFNRNSNTAFEYSNLSYALLGRVITIASGQRYEDYISQEILKPLGMTSSTFLTEEISDQNRAVGYAKFAAGLTAEPETKHGAFTPMGGLHSTVNDLAKWVASYQNGRAEEQTPYRFAQAWMAEPIDGVPERVTTSAYGYGLFVDDDSILGRSIHHSGGYPGFGSHMRWHQSSGWAIVALGNVTYAPMRVIGGRIINHLAQLHRQDHSSRIDIGTDANAAMVAVNSLINNWDNDLADSWFAENMDLDQPREERIADLLHLASGKSHWQPVEGSIAAPTRSFIKWRVSSDESLLEIEMLMSPEKSQRIQKLVLRAASN